MPPPLDPDLTADVPPPADSLDAGLAAGFGPPSGPPPAAGPSVLASFRHTYGVLRPVVLRDADPADSAHVVRPHSDAMPPPRAAGSRYQLFGEIARGGMGAVLRGRDADLGRDLAVKVLLDKHAASPEVARRFIEEAQVGAQLQHPGVVPVYDLGRFGDRPYFTMKLVKGRTLAALLAERSDPADDRPRFLGVFLQVCQTLAYAHAKGVIHRDLKPANVMVGSFGEVQVMDWGLAKVLPEGGVADEARAASGGCQPPGVEPTVIRTARSGTHGSGAGSDTVAGSLLGTPAYMPPEQANGDVERLDRRADVFGLGAVLCEILTGQPPYVGRSGDEVRRKAANGDQTETLARLDACGTDAELVALAKACLAPEPADRPRDAQAAADAVADYLNGVQERLRRAEIGRAEAVVRAAEERKRRRVQLALAASVLLLAGLGGGGAWWADRQAAERARERALAEQRARQALENTLDQAEAALRAGRLAEADAALAQAGLRRADADPDLRDRHDGLAWDRQMLRALDEAVERRIADPVRSSRNSTVLDAASRRYAETFRGYGLAVGGDPPETVAERARASRIATALTAGLSDWFFLDPKQPGLRPALDRLDPDPFRAEVRAAVAAGRRARIAELGAQADGAAHPAWFVAGWGGHPALAEADAVRLLKAAWDAHPGTFLLALKIGGRLDRGEPSGEPRAAEAVGWYRAALAVRPDSFTAWNGLGSAFSHTGDLRASVAAYRQALRLSPRFGPAHGNLALVLIRTGNLDGALAAARRAVELMPEDDWVYLPLGDALRAAGDYAAAAANYRKAIDLGYRRAGAYHLLSAALAGMKDWDGALAAADQAVALDPKDPAYHARRGQVLAWKGDWPAAAAAYRRATEVAPAVPLGYAQWASALARGGRPAEALRVCRDALREHPQWPDRLTGGLRYDAACYAALAAAGQGADAPPPAERPALRREALDWLRAELTACARDLAGGRADPGPPVADRLRHWQQDPDLAGVRGEAALAALPEAERGEWRKFWADVTALLQQAEAVK